MAPTSCRRRATHLSLIHIWKISLADAKQEIADKEKELEDGKAEYEKAKADAEPEIADAKQEIADGEKTLADLKKPTWYVWGRDKVCLLYTSPVHR